METAPTKESVTADVFAEAYGKGFRKTVRFLNCRYGLPQTEAEEFAQAAWVQGWQSRSTLREAAALPAWINTIALNLLRGDRRTAWRREELAQEPTVESNSPTAGIEAEQALRLCSPRDSRLLVGRYLFGYSTAELASQEQIGDGAIRIRLFRACQQLRRAAQTGIGEVSRTGCYCRRPQ